jgi:hypothetical protein
MPIPKNIDLYNFVKHEADKIYKKSSAYKSGFIVRKYKELGGEYIDDNQPKNLQRWYEKEKWININPLLGKTGYPTYRPTVKANSKTPKTVQELSLKRLNEQYLLKQKIKGKKNLPKF